MCQAETRYNRGQRTGWRKGAEMEFKVDKEVALAVCILLAFLWRNRRLIAVRPNPFAEYARTGEPGHARQSSYAASS